MPTVLVVIITVLAVLGLQLAWALYMGAHGQRGPIRTTAVIYEHEVGTGTHEHSYSPLVPEFITGLRFRAATRKCVYQKLDRSPGAVWDEEIRHIADRQLGGYDARNATQWDEAEKILFSDYGLESIRGRSVHGPSTRTDPIARAQLARSQAGDR